MQYPTERKEAVLIRAIGSSSLMASDTFTGLRHRRCFDSSGSIG